MRLREQSLESVYLPSIVLQGGLIDALLELKDTPLDLLPRNVLPFIHRGLSRGHDMLALTRSSIFHVLVSPSAYPAAFPQALASETIPQLIRIRWTPTPFTERADESLLRSCAPFAVERRIPLFAGLLWSAAWITSSLSSRAGFPAGFTMSVLDQANSPRRLAPIDDECVGSYSYPCSTLLGGVSGQAPGGPPFIPASPA